MSKPTDKAPYQPWSEDTFQSDPWVRRAPPRQRDMYGNLLRAAWAASTRPYLKDDGDLWVLANAVTPEEWEANKEAVLSRFTRRADGFLEQARVTRDWQNFIESREDIRAKRAEAGRQGGLAKASNCQQEIARAKQTVANLPNSNPESECKGKGDSDESSDESAYPLDRGRVDLEMVARMGPDRVSLYTRARRAHPQIDPALIAWAASGEQGDYALKANKDSQRYFVSCFLEKEGRLASLRALYKKSKSPVRPKTKAAASAQDDDGGADVRAEARH